MKNLWKRSSWCFPKFCLSPITHYCACSYKKHLNNCYLYNIAEAIFHKDMVAEYYILFLLIVYTKVVVIHLFNIGN